MSQNRPPLSGLRTLLAAAWFTLIAFPIAGCREPQAKPQPDARAPSSAASSKTAAVPLRVWFVADKSAQSNLERHWQASSERPLALTLLSEEELARANKCESDVVVFPAHMLGELIVRDWVVELPNALQSKVASDGSSPSGRRPSTAREPDSPLQAADVQPAGWTDQARFGRRLWGISVSLTAPVVLSNFTLPESFGAHQDAVDEGQSSADPKAYWKSLIEALAAQSEPVSEPRAPQTSGPLEVDAMALCDRYMTIVTSLLERAARVGMLFDPETLRPRLTEPEFVEAAKILQELHQANGSSQALLGSSDAAWQALLGGAANVTIGLPPSASAELDKVTTIRATLPPKSVARAGSRIARGWNSGRGLIVAVSAQCRQTSQAIEFIRWLSGEPTRQVLSRQISGITSQSTYAPSSSAWQAQRLSNRLADQPRLPMEPRLSRSIEYRRALGEQLARILRDEQTAEEGLQAAADAWKDITADDRKMLRANYEASLGL